MLIIFISVHEIIVKIRLIIVYVRLFMRGFLRWRVMLELGVGMGLVMLCRIFGDGWRYHVGYNLIAL
jgi:hypothetical protein